VAASRVVVRVHLDVFVAVFWNAKKVAAHEMLLVHVFFVAVKVSFLRSVGDKSVSRE